MDWTCVVKRSPLTGKYRGLSTLADMFLLQPQRACLGGSIGRRQKCGVAAAQPAAPSTNPRRGRLKNERNPSCFLTATSLSGGLRSAPLNWAHNRNRMELAGGCPTVSAAKCPHTRRPASAPIACKPGSSSGKTYIDARSPFNVMCFPFSPTVQGCLSPGCISCT